MLPREITTERSPERTRFDLPMRDIGPLRFFGLLPMLFAVVFVWMPGREIVRMATRNLSGHGSSFEWVFVVFLSVFVIVGLMPFGIGLFILAGRTRVTVTKDKLSMTELAGPVWWSRKVMFDEVERLEIGGAKSADGQTPSFLANLCGITVILKNGKKTPVAIGYPRTLLQPLVAEISSLMQRRGKTVTVAEITPKPESDLEVIETEHRPEKPTGSPIELTSTGSGAEFSVPARGLFKGSYGLIQFSIFWCTILSVISVSVIRGESSLSDRMAALGFFSIFWAVGIGMLVIGVHLGTRRWSLKADHSQLQITLKSALRSRQWRWAASEIGEIRVGDSRTKVNGRTIEQLQILGPPGGRKTGLLSGCTHEELAWIATTLQGISRGQTSESPEAPPRIDHSQKAR